MQNPYLYIDALSFGFEGENIETHILYDNLKPIAVLYRYYTSLQICTFYKNISVLEIADFIKAGNFQMVSGDAEIIKAVGEICEDYDAYFGYIMLFDGETNIETSSVTNAVSEDCFDIARLICSDESIGGHYSPNVLEKQLRERMLYWNCKNVIIKQGDGIAAHAATYAECSDFSIIGGVITDTNYRGKGYGRQIVDFLVQKIIAENKKPILYCYDAKTVKWYEKGGWKVYCRCGKLEQKKG